MAAVSAAAVDPHPSDRSPPSTPGRFLKWLHGDVRLRVCVVQRIVTPQGDEVWRNAYVLAGDNVGLLDDLVRTIPEGVDTYTMINETRSHRANDHVRCIKACVVDLDAHGPADPPAREIVRSALDKLRLAQIPAPHLIVYTGRGAQLIWRLKRVGLTQHDWNAKDRWTLVQKHLALVCGQHADGSLVDLARLIRMPGTTNTKARGRHRLTWSEWGPSTTEAIGFDDLADAVLPERREVVRPRNLAFRAAAGKPKNGETQPEASSPSDEDTLPKKRKRHRPAKAVACNLEAVARRRLEDYKQIAAAYKGLIPTGFRDKFAFVVACDLAWITPLALAQTVDKVILQHLNELGVVAAPNRGDSRPDRSKGPLAFKEARGYLGTVVKRFRQAAEGLELDYKGHKRCARYWLTTERIYNDLRPILEGKRNLHAKLQELLPDGRRELVASLRRRQSKAASDAARDRVQEGRYERHMPSLATRRQSCEAVRQGEPIAAVASRTGVTCRTLHNWLKRDDTRPLEAVPAPAPACRQDAPQTEKSPELYMAQPLRIKQGLTNLDVVGSPDCGQAEGLSIMTGSSVECGARRNPLAGCPQAPSCGQRRDPHGRVRADRRTVSRVGGPGGGPATPATAPACEKTPSETSLDPGGHQPGHDCGNCSESDVDGKPPPGQPPP